MKTTFLFKRTVKYATIYLVLILTLTFIVTSIAYFTFTQLNKQKGKIMEAKSYIGDGVYVENLGYGAIRLYTSNGIKEENTIYLEQETFMNLLQYLETRTNWTIKKGE